MGGAGQVWVHFLRATVINGCLLLTPQLGVLWEEAPSSSSLPCTGGSIWSAGSGGSAGVWGVVGMGGMVQEVGVTGRTWWHPRSPRALVTSNEAACPWDVWVGPILRGGDGDRESANLKNGDTAKPPDWGNWRALGDPERRDWGMLGTAGHWGTLGVTGTLGGCWLGEPWEDASRTGEASEAAAATGRGRWGAASGLPSALPGALQQGGLLVPRVSLAPP